MSRSVQTISNFCEKIEDVDPDLRQMALFDLQEQLNRPEFTVTDSDQDRMIPKVMTAFTAREINSEVHSQSVRMLTTLTPKLSAKWRGKVADQLVQTMAGTLSETKADVIRVLRENAGMGLKAMIEGLADDHKDTVQAMVPNLLAGLKSSDNKIKTDVFDVLGDVVKRFGKAIVDKHAEIQEGAVSNMGGDLGLRKKAVACLANLCSVSSDALFEQVLGLTVEGLQKDRGDKLRRHIQLCNTISRVAADRFGTAVEKVIPFFFNELDRLKAAGESAEDAASDEVRENILQALDSFVSRCPNSVTPLLTKIVVHCGDLLKWDPNYCVDEDEEEADEEFDDDEEEMDDDDDASWKVRKSAARCLVSVVRSRPDQLKMVYGQLCDASKPLLPGRFKERVENVRLEILEIFKALLGASKLAFNADSAPASGSFQMSAGMLGGSFRTVFEARPEAAALIPIKASLTKNLIYASKHKSPKVKLAVFFVLRDMFALIGPELTAELPSVAQITITTLKDPKCALPQLRPDVLSFTRVLVSVGVSLVNQAKDESTVSGIVSSLESLFAPVFAAADDRYFKTVVAALRVCLEFVAAVRISANAGKLAGDLFKCVFDRLRTGDADQDVKRAAVEAMAMLLKSLEAPLAKTVGGDLEKTYEQFLVLLKNETTRLTVTKAILVVNACKIPQNILKDFANELSTLLRKSDRQVREAALRTLGAFIPKHHTVVDPKTMASIIDELCTESGALLNDKELFLTSLGLQLLRSVAQAPSQAGAVTKQVIPRVLTLLSSPLIQGACVTDAANLFRSLAGRSDISQAAVLGAVVDACKRADASNIGNLSVILGAACVAESADSKAKVVSEFCGLAKQSGKELVGLACLGELGRTCDCAKTSSPVIRAHVKSTSEDVKAAASSALGKTASSSFGKPLLDEIVVTIRKDQNERYFLLRALKECIVAIANDVNAANHSLKSDDSKTQIVSLLLEFAPSTEDGIAEIVAECLGRLAQVDSNVINTLAATLGGAKDDVIACLISAMRFAGVAKQSKDSIFAKCLPQFLVHLNAASPLKTRRAAIQLFGQVAYGSPALLLTEELKAKYFPGLVGELAVNKSLIQEVDLGPFKHIVDNGLDLRKLAYECVGTLVDSIGRNNSILDFVGDFKDLAHALTAGLGVPEGDLDIQMSVRSMLIKLSRTPAGQSAIMANIDTISTSLKKTVQTGPKDGQDKEKVVDGQRHGIVCALKLEAVPGSLQNANFTALMTAARASSHFGVASRHAGNVE